MKKLVMAVSAAAMTFAFVGCETRQEERIDEEAELRQEQRELDSAANRTYGDANERAEEIRDEQQDVREESRELSEERDTATGGSGDESLMDAEDMSTQELPNKE